jgi:hypothetical protein
VLVERCIAKECTTCGNAPPAGAPRRRVPSGPRGKWHRGDARHAAEISGPTPASSDVNVDVLLPQQQ